MRNMVVPVERRVRLVLDASLVEFKGIPLSWCVDDAIARA